MIRLMNGFDKYFNQLAEGDLAGCIGFIIAIGIGMGFIIALALFLNDLI